MTKGGLLTTTWPRLWAHAIILLTVAAIWVAPHAQVVTASAASSGTVEADQAPVPQPLAAMAQRPRAASLPIAGLAVQQLPLPAAKTTAARPVAKGTSYKRSFVSLQPAKYSPPPPPARDGWGNDISWPQCDGAYPGGHDVGVVGITNGRPFTTNPCLSSQFGWARASSMAGGAQAYINLEIGGTSDGPHRCGQDDHACRAYDYGMVTLVDSLGRAYQAGVHPSFIWLDVEVGNNWSDTNPEWNAETVQGAIDAAHLNGYDVGIYSSADQWIEILPGFYHPGVPTWLAVVGDAPSSHGLCAPRFSLTGGPVYLVQFDDHGFDSDAVCAAGAGAFAVAAAHHPN